MPKIRGRKPKPTNLKLIQGNPGKRPINNDEPVPDDLEKPPRSPTYLDKVGKKEWRRVAKEVVAMGTLKEVDLKVLEAYCYYYSQWLDSIIKISKTGSILKSPNGYPIQNPLLSVANRAYEKWMSAASELGIGAAQRSRIKVKDKPKKKNPVEEFLLSGKKKGKA